MLNQRRRSKHADFSGTQYKESDKKPLDGHVWTEIGYSGGLQWSGIPDREHDALETQVVCCPNVRCLCNKYVLALRLL